MSLYNAIFGRNPFAPLLLEVLGVSPNQVPRLRDCYLGATRGEIVIYTRTGGGNRDYYESESTCRANYPEHFDGESEPPSGPWNDDLRNIAGFVSDRDDDLDSTYAHFHYQAPEHSIEMIETLRDLGAHADPTKRWQEMLAGLNKRDRTNPDVERAIAVGEKLGEQIAAAMKGEHDPKIEI